MVRDLHYEQLNTIYDECYQENRIKCKNYELCQHTLPLEHYAHYAQYLCITCDNGSSGFGWNDLEFRIGEEECVVCNETSNTQLKFPANCGHWFCVSCSRNILFFNESQHHLSPMPYGCPPCPNGCINPKKGTQCYCKEYDEILERWEQENPDKYKEWNDAEDISIFDSERISGSVFGSKQCPLCRKKYERV